MRALDRSGDRPSPKPFRAMTRRFGTAKTFRPFPHLSAPQLESHEPTEIGTAKWIQQHCTVDRYPVHANLTCLPPGISAMRANLSKCEASSQISAGSVLDLSLESLRDRVPRHSGDA